MKGAVCIPDEVVINWCSTTRQTSISFYLQDILKDVCIACKQFIKKLQIKALFNMKKNYSQLLHMFKQTVVSNTENMTVILSKR